MKIPSYKSESLCPQAPSFLPAKTQETPNAFIPRIPSDYGEWEPQWRKYTIVAEVVAATDGAGNRNSWGTDLTRCLLELAPFVSAGRGAFVDAVCEAFRASVIFDWQIAAAFCPSLQPALSSRNSASRLCLANALAFAFFLEFRHFPKAG